MGIDNDAAWSIFVGSNNKHLPKMSTQELIKRIDDLRAAAYTLNVLAGDGGLVTVTPAFGRDIPATQIQGLRDHYGMEHASLSHYSDRATLHLSMDSVAVFLNCRGRGASSENRLAEMIVLEAKQTP